MSYSIEPLIFEKFRGIREYNGVNSNGEISALTCNNVALVQTEIGNAVGIKSMDGNFPAYALPAGFKIIGIFSSLQENTIYRFIYAENTTKGVLFYLSEVATEPQIIIDNLSLTGNCNGLTMTSSAFDVFVFTNGKEAKTVCFTSDANYGDTVKTITAKDYQNREIHWLSMAEWNGFLVVASEYGVHSSHQNDIYKWNDNPQDVADAWFIDFSKKVTAVFAFTGGLYIFTADDCTFLNTTPNDVANAVRTTATGVGCYSYQSIVKHDLYLFFYDDNQKNIYYLSATDITGQIKPTGPLAKEIQSYFREIKRFKMYSCIYDTHNEIWCIVNDNILIYDYAQHEWITRQEQSINTIALINNTVFSGGNDGIIYVENFGSDFAGVHYPSVYETTIINSNSNTNLKKQKTPLLLTLNADYINDFWVQLTVNNKPKNPKRVKLKRNVLGLYAVDPETEDPRSLYGSACYTVNNSYLKTVVEISTPQVWYTMQVKIFTQSPNQGFYISSMELKNIKVKTKTKGR